MATWETVIGLEIHAQLATSSKIFSGASTAFGAQANTQACAVDLGFPGVLPVLNAEAVTMAVKFGVAINAEITPKSVFARKNYFYPDLPKGYQISQFELPIVGRGQLSISPEEGVSKVIGITRAHLEEDAGKSLHEEFPDQTGIDLNRAGTPLLEIVSEPDLRSAREAVTYARNQWQALRRYTEDGRLTIDNNVSERTLRHQAVGRKNWLFLGSEAAGPRAAVLYTILAGAKRHRIETGAYVRDLLLRLNADDLRLEEMLPDRWAADHPEAILNHRLEESRTKAIRTRARRALRK